MKLAQTIADELVAHLKQFSDMMTTHRGKREDWPYSDSESFVLQEGTTFLDIEPTPEHMQGEIKQCFFNAHLLCVGDPSLTYIEGYAIGVIPTLHAWVLRPDGVIMDPTWRGIHRDVGHGIAYIGVPFNTKWVSRYRRRYKTLSILDAWERKWPMLSKPQKDWKRSIPVRT